MTRSKVCLATPCIAFVDIYSANAIDGQSKLKYDKWDETDSFKFSSWNISFHSWF